MLAVAWYIVLSMCSSFSGRVPVGGLDLIFVRKGKFDRVCCIRDINVSRLILTYKYIPCLFVYCKVSLNFLSFI